MRTAEIDRVSPAGNPIAKEKIDNRPLIIYGASRGDIVEVEIFEDEDGKLLGSIVDPSPEQMELAKEQIERRVERAKKIEKLKKQKQKRKSLTEQAPDTVDNSKFRGPNEPKTHQDRTNTKNDSSDNDWKDGNKNHLLQKDL